MRDADEAYRGAVAMLQQGRLAECRRLIEGAASTGHVAAGRAHAALLATGRGGPREWRGALIQLERLSAADPLAALQLDMIARMRLTAEGDPVSVPQARSLHPQKPISLFPGLLSREECAALIAVGGNAYIPARIYDRDRRAFVQDPSRDNEISAFPALREGPFVHAVNRRIAAASRTDVAQGEVLQLLRYAIGQQFRPHVDAGPGLIDNQRIMTALVYLNGDYAGGETLFTRLGLSVRGGIGDMLLFGNVDDRDRPDDRMEHAGRPVTAGTKCVASRWIRRRPVETKPSGDSSDPWRY